MVLILKPHLYAWWFHSRDTTMMNQCYSSWTESPSIVIYNHPRKNALKKPRIPGNHPVDQLRTERQSLLLGTELGQLRFVFKLFKSRLKCNDLLPHTRKLRRNNKPRLEKTVVIDERAISTAYASTEHMKSRQQTKTQKVAVSSRNKSGIPRKRTKPPFISPYESRGKFGTDNHLVGYTDKWSEKSLDN